MKVKLNGKLQPLIHSGLKFEKTAIYEEKKKQNIDFSLR